MTLAEYYLRLEANELRRNQVNGDLVALAFAIRDSQAAKKDGRYVFKRTSAYYDPSEQVDEIRQRYESDYKPRSKKGKATNAGQAFANRMAEFKRLKDQGKIIPLNERKGAETIGKL